MFGVAPATLDSNSPRPAQWPLGRGRHGGSFRSNLNSPMSPARPSDSDSEAQSVGQLR